MHLLKIKREATESCRQRLLDTINDLHFILNKIDAWSEFAIGPSLKAFEIETPTGSLGIRIKSRMFKARVEKKTHCCKRKEAKLSRNKKSDASLIETD